MTNVRQTAVIRSSNWIDTIVWKNFVCLRTLSFAFDQPPIKSFPKSFTQKKSPQIIFRPPKSPQIANFKPKTERLYHLPGTNLPEDPGGWSLWMLIKSKILVTNFSRCLVMEIKKYTIHVLFPASSLLHIYLTRAITIKCHYILWRPIFNQLDLVCISQISERTFQAQQLFLKGVSWSF